MAGVPIQIKRSPNVTPATTDDLLLAELGYSMDSANDGEGAALYIEALDSANQPVIHKIGGKYLTDLVDAATSANTADTLVKRDADGSFSATFINTTVPRANTLTVGRYINLFGDLTGSAFFDGSANADINVSVDFSNVTVILGENTTGDYVANVLAGTGIEITGQGGETANVTVNLADTTVTPGVYGGSNDVPVFEVDAQGRLISASNVSISTSFDIDGDSGGPETINTGNTINFIGGTGITTTVAPNSITFDNDGILNVLATANQIDVSYNNQEATLSLPDHIVAPGNLVVTGDFFVNGNTTIINTSELATSDSLIKLANNNILSDTLDIGFYGVYNDGDVAYTGLIRSASDGLFHLFHDLDTDPFGNVVALNSADHATLFANLTGGNVSGLASAIGVSDGGTGNTTFLANSVIVGNLTDPLHSINGNDGEVLMMKDGLPTFAVLDGGVY